MLLVVMVVVGLLFCSVDLFLVVVYELSKEEVIFHAGRAMSQLFSLDALSITISSMINF